MSEFTDYIATLDYFHFMDEDPVVANLINEGTEAEIPTVVDPTPATGMHDGGLSFNGTSNYCQLFDSPNFSAGAADILLGGWFKGNENGGTYQVAMSVLFGLGFDECFCLQPWARWSVGSAQGARVWVESINTSPDIEFDLDDNTAVSDGLWHWHCAEKIGTTLNYYFDNPTTPVKTTSSGIPATLGANIFINIGSRYQSADTYPGIADDVFAHVGLMSAEQKYLIKNHGPPVVDSSNSQQTLIP